MSTATLDLTGTTTLLLDADGTLFPSEEPAFDASAGITREFADRFGLTGDFSPEHLRLTTTGKNFRTTAGNMLAEVGASADADEFDRWVEREKREVSAHLGRVLRPQPDVVAALSALRRRYRLAVVSSSALGRLAACFTASGLDDLLPPDVRFSAEDSLPTPTSKPDPAVYLHALRRLGVTPEEALAVEDSATGAGSAVAAGITTAGIVQFVPEGERAERVEVLGRAGAAWVVRSWDELAGHLLDETFAVSR
ncbi:HAD family phosphatase [Saccharothrix longispora]|uniref:HAD family hydrolase n=1 Tax=Saccharothrix longispora TaxID=33920 RepID=UPI0028FDA8BB|nr:HAD family phosphatase [Saccharothrix longispora]MBY8848809.1 HAD family phosphatase [Saccharothrix sp. MB29]MDU0293970.1 HAD family phosphatase [Saccharothrix longispora]